MTHQCYYCNQVFKSKKDLYDHLVLHSKTKSRQYLETDEKKEENIKIQEPVENKYVSKDYQPEPNPTTTEAKIDLLKKKIEKIQEKTKSI